YGYYQRYLGDDGDRAGWDQTTTADVGRRRTGRGKGDDTSGQNTDAAMTRSEEQLQVGTEKVEAGRARLRKYVVTEQQSVQVPVSREEVRGGGEPINDGTRGDELTRGEHTDTESSV